MCRVCVCEGERLVSMPMVTLFKFNAFLSHVLACDVCVCAGRLARLAYDGVAVTLCQFMVVGHKTRLMDNIV